MMDQDIITDIQHHVLCLLVNIIPVRLWAMVSSAATLVRIHLGGMGVDQRQHRIFLILIFIIKGIKGIIHLATTVVKFQDLVGDWHRLRAAINQHLQLIIL